MRLIVLSVSRGLSGGWTTQPRVINENVID